MNKLQKFREFLVKEIAETKRATKLGGYRDPFDGLKKKKVEDYQIVPAEQMILFIEKVLLPNIDELEKNDRTLTHNETI